MRKIRQSPGRPEKLFKREDKGVYVAEYFERAGRRGTFDSNEFAARWKDAGYVFICPADWSRIFSSLYDLWSTCDRKDKAEISLRMGRPNSLGAAIHAAQGLSNPEDILAAMKFCVVANEKTTAPLFEKLEENIIPRLNSLTPDNLSVLLKIYVQRNVHPPAPLIRHLDKMPSDIFSSMQPAAFYDFVRAQSHLGLKLENLNEPLAEAMEQHGPEIPFRLHESFLWSVAVLHSLAPSGAVADAARAFYARTEIASVSVRNSFCRWFDIPFSNENISFRTAPSACEKKLGEIFKAAGGKILNPSDPRTKKFLPPSDLRLAFNGKTLAFEYDGVETHMRKGTDGQYHYNGPTLFNAALAAKFTPGSVHIRIDSRNYKTFLGLPAPRTADLARALLEKAAQLDSGSYTADVGETVRFAPL